MRYLLLVLLLCGCKTFKPPNIAICVPHPDHDHCAWTISGAPFDIDATHPFTLNGQNLTKVQYDAVAMQLDPWSWAIEKKSFLNYCHANPKACVYFTAVQMVTAFENELKFDRTIVPEWTDEMLDPE